MKTTWVGWTVSHLVTVLSNVVLLSQIAATIDIIDGSLRQDGEQVRIVTPLDPSRR